MYAMSQQRHQAAGWKEDKQTAKETEMMSRVGDTEGQVREEFPYSPTIIIQFSGFTEATDFGFVSWQFKEQRRIIRGWSAVLASFLWINPRGC